MGTPTTLNIKTRLVPTPILPTASVIKPKLPPAYLLNSNAWLPRSPLPGSDSRFSTDILQGGQMLCDLFRGGVLAPHAPCSS